MQVTLNRKAVASNFCILPMELKPILSRSVDLLSKNFFYEIILYYKKPQVHSKTYSGMLALFAREDNK